MITITKIEQQFKDNKPSGFKVNLSDGTWGYLVEKDSDKDLKDGEAITYTAEQPSGKSYKKLTIKRASSTTTSSGTQSSDQPPLRPAIHVGSGKSIQELKADASIKSAEVVVDAFLQGKIEWAMIEEKQRYLSSLLWSEIDDIFGKK